MKKFFIKICKLLGYEILDQNHFSSPTLGKELNEELSILNEKSIVLPLGEVKITKKVNSILIVLRMNTCLLYTSPSPRDGLLSRMPSSA